MRTEPTTERGRRTVERVIDAACVLFARQGIRATTLDQVGAESGTGRGQLYLFFGGKSDLVTEVVTRQVERVLAAQQPLLDSFGTAAEVREWCRIAADQYAQDDPVRCPIGSLVYELAEQEPDAQTVLASGFARWQEALAAGLARVQARGELADGADPDAVAALLLAAYEGGILLAGVHGRTDVLRQALAGVTSVVLVDRAG